MKSILDVMNERQQVYAQLMDVRAKRREDGSFEDPLAMQTIQNLNERYASLTALKNDLEVQERQAKEMVEKEIETRETEKAAGNVNATYDESFWRWVTNPVGAAMQEHDKRMLETRGTSTQIGTTDSLGGYTIPQSFANTIEISMKHYSGMLEACDIMDDTIGGQLKYPSLDDTATNGAIIGQGVATTVSDLTFGNVLFGEWTIDSKIIKMSAELLNDNRVGLAQAVLADLLPNRLGRAVNSQLTSGTGTSSPYGLKTVVTNSALTTAGATAITKAELLRLRYSIDKAYSNGPKFGFMMHYTILGYLQSLDLGNSDTVQLFRPSNTPGVPDQLLGLPVWINNDLDAANGTTGLPVTAKKHIYFGDFSKYKIRRIGGVSLSRNDSLYWAERAAGFMGFLRIDGNLVNSNAIKFLTQA